MKQNLFKNTLTIGIAACAFGVLSACAPLGSSDEKANETTSAAASKPVCTSESDVNCIVTYEEPDLNLSQAYAGYAMSTNASYQSGSAPISLSAPNRMTGSSVKDRAHQKELAQQEADLALQPVLSADVLCAGPDCEHALFKTELEKTYQTTMLENQPVPVTVNGKTIVPLSSGPTVRSTQGAQAVPTAQAAQAPQAAPAAPAAQGAQAAPAAPAAQGAQAAPAAPAAQGAQGVPMVSAAQGAQAVQATQGTQTIQSAQTVLPTQAIQSVQTIQTQTVQQPVLSLKERIAYGKKVHDWDAPAGETLRTLLIKWGEQSGWTVVWKMDRDYNLEAGVIFRGKFTEVAAAFIRSFARATPAPIGTFYKGNRVLVINTQENDNAE